MKIRCINNFISSENSCQSIINWANNSELEVTIGKIYTVFAVSKYFDIVFYYILSDESNEYPLAYPFHLFEIYDYNISKFWVTSLKKIQTVEDINIENQEIISFKEWSYNGDRFYENLIEGKNQEVLIFKDYRVKMLLE